jgi:hypothetical protein
MNFNQLSDSNYINYKLMKSQQDMQLGSLEAAKAKAAGPDRSGSSSNEKRPSQSRRLTMSNKRFAGAGGNTKLTPAQQQANVAKQDELERKKEEEK